MEPSRRQASVNAGVLIIAMGRARLLEKHGVSEGVAGGGNSKGCGGELEGAGMCCSGEQNVTLLKTQSINRL